MFSLHAKVICQKYVRKILWYWFKSFFFHLDLYWSVVHRDTHGLQYNLNNAKCKQCVISKRKYNIEGSIVYRLRNLLPSLQGRKTTSILSIISCFIVFISKNSFFNLVYKLRGSRAPWSLLNRAQKLLDAFKIRISHKSSSRQSAFQWVRIVPRFSPTSFCIHTKRISYSLCSQREKKRLASWFNLTNRYIDDVLSIKTQNSKITWARYILLNLRSRTPQRAPLLRPTLIYYCRLGGMVNFTLRSTTNETIKFPLYQLSVPK